MNCKNKCSGCQALKLCIDSSEKRANTWNHIINDLNLPHIRKYLGEKITFKGSYYVESFFRIWTVNNIPVAWSEDFK